MSYGVLLVDDEPLVTEALKRALYKETYKVYCASSAMDALNILSHEEIDVVVSDEMMPGMLGSDFLGVVCSEYPDTVRIILTGHPSLNGALRAINKGHVHRFLIKPCSGPELSVTIKQAIQHRQLYRKSLSLLEAARRQRKIINNLERQFPGITKVDTNRDGTICIEDETHDLDSLIEEIGEEVKEWEFFFNAGERNES